MNTLTTDLLNYVKSIYSGTVEADNTTVLEGYSLSIWVPELKVAIQANVCKDEQTIYEKKLNDKGTYSFCETDVGKASNYHYKAARKAFESDIRLIQIWEDQWYNDRLNPTLKAIIVSALNVDPGHNKIYARKCELKEVDKKEYKEFCDKYHTQLSRPADIRLGLYYEGKLVQLASFNKFSSRNGTKATKFYYEYEWVRGCESFNDSRVVGGVSKLFDYFVKNYNPESILCYSDFNLFCGKGYAKSGFVLDGFTGQDKFYIDGTNLKRINRSASKYREYMEKVIAGDWYCCYGAGNLRFVWKKPE